MEAKTTTPPRSAESRGPAGSGGALRRMAAFLRPSRLPLAAAILLAVAAIPLTNLHPWLWKVAVDDVLPSGEPRRLVVLLAVLGGSYVGGLLLRGGHQFLLERVGQRFIRDVRRAVFDRIQNQSLAYHRGNRSGDLVTRVVSDIDAMESSVLRGLASLFEECLTFLFVGAMVVAMQPVIGLSTLIPLAISFLVVKAYNRRVKAIYQAIRRRLGDVGAHVSDRLGGVQLIQSFVRQDRERERFASITEDYRRESVRAAFHRIIFFGHVSFFGFLTNVVMLGLGIWFIWQDRFTLGGLIAYRGFWWRFQSPINTLAQTADILQRARAAAERVDQVLTEPIAIESPAAPAELSRVHGAVAFRDVSFRYGEGQGESGQAGGAAAASDGKDRPDRPDRDPGLVLDGIDFEVRPGEFVVLAGASGSGKTTLLHLVPRFYDVTGGAVLVDGHDVRTWPLDRLRRSVGLVAQESYLFDDTILENIRFARPEAGWDEVVVAARAAHAHDFIEGLPDGYQTRVGEGGVRLSGGQRQRLSIARTFLLDPAVLLLDEPTSSVEPGSEAAIHEALLELSEGRATLLATHRVALLERASRILFLHDGHLLDEGTHAALLERNPAYRDAYATEPAAVVRA